MQWYIIVLLAALVNALFIIVSKKTLLKEHSIEFSSALSFLILLFSLPLLFFIDLHLSLNQVGMIYAISSIFTIAFLFNIKAIRHMDVSIVAPLFTFGAAITSILAVIFLKERFALIQGLGIIFLVFGAYVLQLNHKHINFIAPLKHIVKCKYIGYLFTSIFLFACSFLMIRAITNTNSSSYTNPITFVLMLHIFMALNFLMITTLFYNGIKRYKAGLKPLKFMALAALLLISYRLLQFTAISMPATKLAFIMSLNEIYVLFVVVLGGSIFHERNMLRKIIGTLIMLAGVSIIIFGGA